MGDAARIARSDARIIVYGLLADGLDVESLSPLGRQELLRALDRILDLCGIKGAEIVSDDIAGKQQGSAASIDALNRRLERDRNMLLSAAHWLDLAQGFTDEAARVRAFANEPLPAIVNRASTPALNALDVAVLEGLQARAQIAEGWLAALRTACAPFIRYYDDIRFNLRKQPHPTDAAIEERGERVAVVTWAEFYALHDTVKTAPTCSPGNEPMSREKIGETVLETTRMVSQGYRDAITSFDDEARREQANRCAVATHNLGWFILKAIGFSKEEIDKMNHIPAWETRPLSSGE